MTKRLAIQGFATRYHKPYVDEHGVSALDRGCFSDSIRSGQEIHFLRDHDGARRVGSTRGGLTLYDCDDGLAFRLENPPATVVEAIRSGSRRSMSIGFGNKSIERVRADSVMFNLIRKADLGEISLVHRPAISNTSVSIVDLDEVGSLQHCAESGSFTLRGQHSALSNALDDVCQMAAKLFDESAELVRDVIASARASSRSASRGHQRANRRRMPIVDLSFAENSYARQPGAWETYMFMAGEDAFSDYVNSYTRRSAQ
ncbi:MAG: HK97 family phage prohead protease [Rhizobium sp.]|nr:HK97 family phage prohead protease [Rhizobium sp.]MBW8319264.1 HK97 family phage prohead protease [Rhizobium sp.]